eukprot:2708112-Rhodomonas_salina.1
MAREGEGLEAGQSAILTFHVGGPKKRSDPITITVFAIDGLPARCEMSATYNRDAASRARLPIWDCVSTCRSLKTARRSASSSIKSSAKTRPGPDPEP